MINLNFDIKFKDLYSIWGLRKIDQKFLNFLETKNNLLLKELLVSRRKNYISSEIIIKISPYLDDFITILFNLKYSRDYVHTYNKKIATIFECRRKFVERKVKKDDYDKTKIKEAIFHLQNNKVNLEDEISIATNILQWIKSQNNNMLQYAKTFAAWVIYSELNKKKYKDSILFKVPEKINFDRLIQYKKSQNGRKYFTDVNISNRNGFNLTEKYLNQNKVIVDVNYCLYCHKQNKDSCSKGFIDKKTNNFLLDHFKIPLKGCPLKEKISEMNFLKKEGIIIGAFATGLINNPMIAATGHRICNDCMKSCIYQKQEPVNIPLVETKLLDDVLRLDYGFEIYSLLTQWNPLKATEYLPKKPNNHKILIVGMGPAGFTLAHYLTNEGLTVVGIDGLKIEPLPSELSGVLQNGSRVEFKPIKKFSDIEEDLSQRKAYGFGGVAEYGITVRWNKNYLTVLRLILERRSNFKLYGSVRFGSTITYNSAKKLDFDHVALAVGAGKPNIPRISNMLCKGVRLASDFLMSLQTLCVTRDNIFASLQIRLPIVVIGGGLTSIDAATESLAYYPKMIEKFLVQYNKLGECFLKNLDQENVKIALEFIKHAKEIKKSPQNKLQLLKKWGGVKIIYRKELENSPAYQCNHIEFKKSFEEGIEFIDDTAPIKILLDKFNHCRAIVCNNKVVPAKTIIIATGTEPNTSLSEEDTKNFQLDGKYLTLIKDKSQLSFFTKLDDDFSFSILGDAHPHYSGSVVKAMASAKESYKIITKKVLSYRLKNKITSQEFFAKLNIGLISKVIKTTRLTNNVIEIHIKSPMAANEFRPGQFFRLQNFEANAKMHDGYIRAIEPLALTGASVNKKRGIISLIVLEMGGTSNFCQDLKVGEIVSLMGPTGSATFIPKKENVILVGGGLGNAVLFSIGKQLIKNGCHVLYFAGYKKINDIFKREEIKKSANEVVWCCDESVIKSVDNNDQIIHGNIVKALTSYNKMFSHRFKLRDFDRMIVIGSDLMMKAVSYSVQNELKKFLNPNIKAYVSLNSTMQCMMKGICAQCLQKHINPETKLTTFVYSCFNQDQDLKCVDFESLSYRLKQNSLLEKLTSSLIDLSYAKNPTNS